MDRDDIVAIEFKVSQWQDLLGMIGVGLNIYDHKSIIYQKVDGMYNTIKDQIFPKERRGDIKQDTTNLLHHHMIKLIQVIGERIIHCKDGLTTPREALVKIDYAIEQFYRAQFPEGISMVGIDNPAQLHEALAKALGEK